MYYLDCVCFIVVVCLEPEKLRPRLCGGRKILYVRVFRLSHTKVVSVITRSVSRGTSSRVPSLPSHNVSQMSYHARAGSAGPCGQYTGVTTTRNCYDVTNIPWVTGSSGKAPYRKMRGFAGRKKTTAIWSLRHCKPAACILGPTGANMRLSLICGFPRSSSHLNTLLAHPRSPQASASPPMVQTAFLTGVGVAGAAWDSGNFVCLDHSLFARRLRPISLPRLSLPLRFLDTTFPGNSQWAWEFHPNMTVP